MPEKRTFSAGILDTDVHAFRAFVLHALVFLPVYPFQKSELFNHLHQVISMQLGAGGVTFFFILSGFLIFWSFPGSIGGRLLSAPSAEDLSHARRSRGGFRRIASVPLFLPLIGRIPSSRLWWALAGVTVMILAIHTAYYLMGARTQGHRECVRPATRARGIGHRRVSSTRRRCGSYNPAFRWCRHTG